MGHAADTSARPPGLERFARRFEAGQVLYEAGQPADACFLVQHGRVRLVKRVRGAEHVHAVLRAGALFGEEALVPDGVRQSTARALTDVELFAIDRDTFDALLASNPEVARRIVEQLVRRLHDAEERLENMSLQDAPSRVVHTLLRLARRVPVGPDGHVLRVSPLELSSRVGLDVDSVKRVVRHLRDGGYLEVTEERLVVPDIEPLRRLYELLGAKEEVRRGL